MTAALARELDAACAQWGGSAGVADASGSFTLNQLAEFAHSVEAALRAQQSQANEPVAVMVSNRARDLAGLWGAWRAGAVAAPVHRTTPTSVAQNTLERLKTRFIVDLEPERTPMEPAIQGRRAGPLFILDRPTPAPRPLLRDAALIVFTSGTTGQPKGAVVSHAAISGKLSANNSILNFTAETRTHLVLQITFSFGMWVALLTLTRGGWLRMEEKFEAARIIPALAAESSDTVALVPSMIRSLFATTDERGLIRQVRELGGMLRLSRVLTGGENLGPTLGLRLMRVFPRAGHFDIYGLTETATCDFFLLPAEHGRWAGCIGKPAPGVKFRIVDESYRLVTAGSAGELQIKTPYLMNGYLDAPELTEAALSNGYFRTGDIGREREPQVVELVGRSKELISRGANKVSPLEIEHVLSAHPAVAEVLACGVPDTILGERIHVLAVLRGGASATAEELRGWAAARLDRYKLPDQIHFGPALPLGRTGKADRGQLKIMFTAGK